MSAAYGSDQTMLYCDDEDLRSALNISEDGATAAGVVSISGDEGVPGKTATVKLMQE